MEKTFVLQRPYITLDAYRYNGLLGICTEFVEKHFGIGPRRKRIKVTVSREPIQGGKGMYFYRRYAAFKYDDAIDTTSDSNNYLYDTAREAIRELFPTLPYNHNKPVKFYLKIV